VPASNGLCTIGLPEWQRASVRVVIATLFTAPREQAGAGWLSYTNPEGAFQQALAQLEIYRRWASTDQRIALITHRAHLDALIGSAEGPSAEDGRVGLVVLMENADPIRTIDDVAFWYEQGVRLIGPAWHANRFTGSTQAPGPLTDLGRELLVAMQRAGIILDLTHMADEACLAAFDVFDGPVVASHTGLRRIIPRDRLISDELVRAIAGRDGVVGIMPANWALDPVAFERRGPKDEVHLDALIDTIDALCQLTGSARHAAIGTDFDGGFGAEAIPAELDSIADLPLIAEALARRGYGDGDVAAIMGGNWLRLLREHLPG
jgi:membrane dipeptidase